MFQIAKGLASRIDCKEIRMLAMFIQAIYETTDITQEEKSTSIVKTLGNPIIKLLVSTYFKRYSSVSILSKSKVNSR